MFGVVYLGHIVMIVKQVFPLSQTVIQFLTETFQAKFLNMMHQ